jgi:hypothetical protein
MTNGSGGVSLAALLLVLVIIGIVRSQQPWRTLLYSLLAGITVVAVTFSMSLLMPGYAETLGFLGTSVGMLAMTGMALNHSRRHRKKPAESVSAPPPPPS